MNAFEQVISRKDTRSVKWGNMETVYGIEDASEILPMWIADMDFAAPQPIIDAMKARLDHGIFGYSYICETCKDAVRTWLSSRHGWETKNEWMLFHHGVVPAIATVVETFTKKGDNVLITTPVYPPFFNVPGHQDRNIIECELKEENGQYSIDFDAFEKCLQQDIKVFILCNPHNPGGVVWTEEELRKVLQLCKQYDVLVLSDEIHADLVLPGHKHIPLAKLATEEGGKVITCVAPTKTFNLAGVQAAIMITDDEELHASLQKSALAHGQMELNAFAASALMSAFTECDEWLDQLLEIITSNINYVIEELPTAVPGIKIHKPQATYLLWVDYRETGLSEEEIMDKLLNKGKLALEPGTKYGEAGRGFLRMNIATPRSIVEDGVERFIKAMQPAVI